MIGVLVGGGVEQGLVYPTSPAGPVADAGPR